MKENLIEESFGLEMAAPNCLFLNRHLRNECARLALRQRRTGLDAVWVRFCCFQCSLWMDLVGERQSIEFGLELQAC